MAVLRETLAAIDNAEAADLNAAPVVQEGVIAGVGEEANNAPPVDRA